MLILLGEGRVASSALLLSLIETKDLDQFSCVIVLQSQATRLVSSWLFLIANIHQQHCHLVTFCYSYHIPLFFKMQTFIVGFLQLQSTDFFPSTEKLHSFTFYWVLCLYVNSETK